MNNKNGTSFVSLELNALFNLRMTLVFTSLHAITDFMSFILLVNVNCVLSCVIGSANKLICKYERTLWWPLNQAPFWCIKSILHFENIQLNFFNVMLTVIEIFQNVYLFLNFLFKIKSHRKCHETEFIVYFRASDERLQSFLRWTLRIDYLLHWFFT